MEFDLINQYFAPLMKGIADKDVGIGDDAAVLTPPEGYQLVVTTDTMVDSVHFLKSCNPRHLAWKLLAVNLSDLAAMGAQPWCYSLALTMPVEIATDQKWLAEFSSGLDDICSELNLTFPLIGGDTTRGPLTLTVIAKGLVKTGEAVMRGGAQLGDVIVVTNTLGEGALGLKVALEDAIAKDVLTHSQQAKALHALEKPFPCTRIAPYLKSYASAALDISDGLMQDLSHLLKGGSFANGEFQALGAEIELSDLPISEGMQRYIAQTDDFGLILTGGDDYQLLMSVAPEKLEEFIASALSKGVALSVIGEVVAQPGIHLKKNGDTWEMGNTHLGFQHF